MTSLLEIVTKCLSYSPETGVLTWKWREDQAFKWNAKWAGREAGSLSKGSVRVRLTFNGSTRTYAGHTLAWLLMTGCFPEVIIDHEDGDGTNNRWSNLRAANYTQNMMNKTKTSGVYPYKGVLKCRGKCRAQIVVSGRAIHLGVFGDPIDAAKVYDRAAIHYFGEFAKTNEMLGLI